MSRRGLSEVVDGVGGGRGVEERGKGDEGREVSSLPPTA